MYLVLYVDDLLLISENKKQNDEVKAALENEFEMTYDRKFEQFLGIGIDYDAREGVLSLSQSKAVQDLLKYLKMEDCKVSETPMEQSLQLKKTEEKEAAANVPYREVIGKLMYMMLSCRPDICFPVSYLSRFQEKPSVDHWKTLKRVVRYLKATKESVLKFKKNPDSEPLVGYADADFASDVNDRKSTSGFLFKVFGNTVGWSSKKQAVVSGSSTEAEYIALFHATQEGMWLKGLLGDLKIDVDTFTMYEDNQSAIKIANNLENKRLKHMDVKFHFIREAVEKRIIHLKYIDTKLQEADMMTKSLGRCQLEVFLKKLGLSTK